jgi:hypothetical protein
VHIFNACRPYATSRPAVQRARLLPSYAATCELGLARSLVATAAEGARVLAGSVDDEPTSRWRPRAQEPVVERAREREALVARLRTRQDEEVARHHWRRHVPSQRKGAETREKDQHWEEAVIQGSLQEPTLRPAVFVEQLLLHVLYPFRSESCVRSQTLVAWSPLRRTSANQTLTSMTLIRHFPLNVKFLGKSLSVNIRIFSQYEAIVYETARHHCRIIPSGAHLKLLPKNFTFKGKWHSWILECGQPTAIASEARQDMRWRWQHPGMCTTTRMAGRTCSEPPSAYFKGRGWLLRSARNHVCAAYRIQCNGGDLASHRYRPLRTGISYAGAAHCEGCLLRMRLARQQA